MEGADVSDLRETVEATVRDTDLSPLQRLILLQLQLAEQEQPLSASEVGEPIGLTPMTIHTNLRKLVEAGRVEVEKVPNFERQQFETAYRLPSAEMDPASTNKDPEREPAPA